MKYLLSLLFLFSSAAQCANVAEAMALHLVAADAAEATQGANASAQAKGVGSLSEQLGDALTQVYAQVGQAASVVQEWFQRQGIERAGVVIPGADAVFGLEGAYSGDTDSAQEWATGVKSEVGVTVAKITAAIKEQLPQRPEGQPMTRGEYWTGIYLPPLPKQEIVHVAKEVGNFAGQIVKGSVHVVDGYAIPQTGDDVTLMDAPPCDALTQVYAQVGQAASVVQEWFQRQGIERAGVVIPGADAVFGLEGAYSGDIDSAQEWATGVKTAVKTAIKEQLPQRPEGQPMTRGEYWTGIYLPPLPKQEVVHVAEEVGNFAGQIVKGSVHVVDGYAIPQTGDDGTLMDAPLSDAVGDYAAEMGTKTREWYGRVEADRLERIARFDEKLAALQQQRLASVSAADQQLPTSSEDSTNAQDTEASESGASVQTSESQPLLTGGASSVPAQQQVGGPIAPPTQKPADHLNPPTNPAPTDPTPTLEQPGEQKTFLTTMYENPGTTALVAAGTAVAVYGGYKVVRHFMKQHEKKKAQKLALQKMLTKVRRAA